MFVSALPKGASCHLLTNIKLVPRSAIRSRLVLGTSSIQWHCRSFSASRSNFTPTGSSPSPSKSDAGSHVENNGTGSAGSQKIFYRGPLAKTFRSLKIFSLSSFGLATTMTPFMFIIETSLPFSARVILASTALVTSGLSTALIGWCGQPYVSTIRTLPNEDPTSSEDNPSEPAEELSLTNGFQLETHSLFLRPRFTNIYDPSFLTETRRPFAKWELVDRISIPKANQVAATEETVAETLDADGRVLSRWIVSWSNDGREGTCRAEGQQQRYGQID